MQVSRSLPSKGALTESFIQGTASYIFWMTVLTCIQILDRIYPENSRKGGFQMDINWSKSYFLLSKSSWHTGGSGSVIL